MLARSPCRHLRQVNVLTEDRSFVRWEGMQVVHGSYITRIYIKARSAATGHVVRAEVRAEQYGSFRVHHADALGGRYANSTRVKARARR